jgi:sigma-B regulation protein RsbU (phosphoserine phosphatase)
MAQILIIDDDPAIQRVLEKAILKEGYQVQLASDGQKGIELAQTLQPSLIICDWVMPGVDGLEVCRQVKAHPNLSTTFFILLTSRSSLEDRVLGLDTGADDFLPKPIEITELHARIRAGLRIHQLTNDLQQQKQLLESELAEASEYVRSLLPHSLESPIQIQTTFIPSRQLGGDCFDYYWLESGELVLFLLDVSGHGLGAALPSVSILNLLRSKSLTDVDFRSPIQVLNSLNRIFQMGGQGDRYFTLWYGVYNPKSYKLTYASGGHPPALLVCPATTIAGTQHIEIQPLRTRGIPIGLFPDSQYTDAEHIIQPGSCLYIFSDGVYELHQPNGEIWGLHRFIELLRSLHAESFPSLSTIQESLIKENNNPVFQDDISLIKVQF